MRQLGESDFADSFGGLRIDHGRNEVTVYRRPSEAFDAALPETVTAVPLVLRDAPYCLRDLREVQRRVGQDTPPWRRADIEITSVGVAPDTRGGMIGVAVLNDATPGSPDRPARRHSDHHRTVRPGDPTGNRGGRPRHGGGSPLTTAEATV